ncbi:MAG: unnamed protein product [uncultured Paraburkholderia sp.]|nr:MAG: unnamed protein product [uncultured Paraburkholderia sp.]CAH2945531.1 MAG: unnamed protein product [uncultured Paraburkholderia sp.]
MGLGQNVFTSDNLRHGCVATLRKLHEKIGFEAPAESWARWKSGDLALHRVDLAVNYDMGSEHTVRALLKRLAHQMVEKRCHCLIHDCYVSLAPRRGTEYCVTAYAKGSQLRAKRKVLAANQVLLRLVDECAGLLRIEVRLRRPELVKLGLSFVRDWTPGKARTVFCDYAAKFSALDVTSGPLSTTDLGHIPPKLRHIYMLHKLGGDLSAALAPRTLARYRAKFRQIGIDISCPNLESAPRNSSLLLKPVATPEWLIDAGMAPPAPDKRSKKAKTAATRSESKSKQ